MKFVFVLYKLLKTGHNAFLKEKQQTVMSLGIPDVPETSVIC